MTSDTVLEQDDHRNDHITHPANNPKPRNRSGRRKLGVIAIVVVLLIGAAVVLYLTIPHSVPGDLSPLCSDELGWLNTPCTYEHGSAEESLFVQMIESAPYSIPAVRKLSWNTNIGRIYLIGCPSNLDYGNDSLFSLLSIPTALAQINLKYDEDEMGGGFCEGGCTSGQGQYFNALGEPIVFCYSEGGRSYWAETTLTYEWEENPRICRLLMDALDAKDADYRSPSECWDEL